MGVENAVSASATVAVTGSERSVPDGGPTESPSASSAEVTAAMVAGVGP